ncbi:MAG: hypothetical protein IT298_15765 [Chloroflexi bacterium]|nr:MAG: peptidoglycan-binding protein LysM [Chloroflexi bacterium OLB13]MBC6955979.1 hypothetical protein [Chloroflexota bacterium]MBV6437493.1 hypothetical protein [Anaerolineae bacterium]MDL1916916.1 hypothetical protein [Anaerolineae bacterium CFX4]OQY83493.1 MAG: hypothetical protein B6D42_07390 [Anaerolineae bacterium UTCFX5]
MPTTRGNVEAAKITNLITEEVVYFQFNPTDFTISKSNTWTPRVVAGLNLPLVSFSQGGPQTITLNLQFDNAMGWRLPPTGSVDPAPTEIVDVRSFTQPLWKMALIDTTNVDSAGKGSPPPVAFEWGDLYFKAIIKQITEKFQLFSPEGIPIRSLVTISLQQYIDETDVPPQVAAAMAAEQSQTTQFTEGERLDNVAAQNGGDPSDYRTVAENNNIDNPNNVPTGTTLQV